MYLRLNFSGFSINSLNLNVASCVDRDDLSTVANASMIFHCVFHQNHWEIVVTDLHGGSAFRHCVWLSVATCDEQSVI